jgi:hypothetical protein
MKGQKYKRKYKKRGGECPNNDVYVDGKLKTLWKKTKSVIEQSKDIIVKNSKPHYDNTKSCFENIELKTWRKILILFGYILFLILPICVIINTILAIKDFIDKISIFKEGKFYGDTMMGSDISELIKLSAFNNFNIFISHYTFGFVIILGLYLISAIIYYFLVNTKFNTNSGCTFNTHYNRITSMYFIMYIIIFIIILIIDIVMPQTFLTKIGQNRDALFNYIKININQEYLGTISQNIITNNTKESLNSYISNITDTLNNDNYSKKVVTACITYFIIKTISDNGYHNTNPSAMNNTFYSEEKNIFNSINVNSNKLIQDDIGSLGSYPNMDKKFNSIITKIIEDCNHVNKEFEKYIANIKTETDSTKSVKGISFVVYIIASIYSGYLLKSFLVVSASSSNNKLLSYSINDESIYIDGE